MTTIVVVMKGSQIAIGSESLTTFGETRLGSQYKRVHDKIITVGDSFLGICGSSAHHLVLASVFAKKQDELKFGSRQEVFETFRMLHPILKDECFLNPKEDDDDPYESSQITALIANPSGIYGVFSYREVFDYDRFWAIGSGRNYALGAMYAAYDRCKTAEEIARIGIEAGIEFDKSSDGPIVMHTLKLRKGRAK